MMRGIHRRGFLAGLATSMVIGKAIAYQTRVKRITLGFSNYGMKAIPYKDAIPYVGKAGFDSMELCLLPGWPTDPKKLGAQDRKDISALIVDSKLKLTALMENLAPSPMPDVGRSLQERLEQAFVLSNELGEKIHLWCKRCWAVVLGKKCRVFMLIPWANGPKWQRSPGLFLR